ncbi:hypothetical protein SAMD00023353_12300060 [Rosellinia necatrix]|uniref:Uncharacterized protein n=1 Tax=Rosellinia necatrix TaxID=77044 RepID=A0A1W2TAE8_ROSNE|nr:hypothetical protein SAMD00023353_12300060 [Rosellinia necatrix]
MSYRAPNAGTKVSAGTNDPVIQEGTGTVRPDSLAAESEAFRQANPTDLGNDKQDRPQEGISAPTPGSVQGPESSPPSTEDTTPRGTGSGGSARSAPSSQRYGNTSRPHGKNIKEDDSIGTGDRAENVSFTAEIGSEKDPSLLAERKFSQANAVPPGSSGGREKAINEQTTYDVLGEREA